MADDDTDDLVFRDVAVHHQAETHQHPRQVRSGKDKHAQEAQLRVRVSAGPNVYECRGERVPQERQGNERRQDDQADHGVQQEPGKVRG